MQKITQIFRFLFAALSGIFFLCVRILWLICANLIFKIVPKRKKDESLLVLFSQVAWCGVWQRPQEEAMGFAQKRPVLYVSPLQAHEPMLRYPAWKYKEYIKTGKGLLVFSPLIFPGHYKFKWIYRLNCLLILAELRAALANVKQMDFFTNTPFVEYLVDRLPVSKVIYDIIDDFIAFSWAPAGADEMEKRLLKRADVVLTGTWALYEQKKDMCKEATFVPCGVDFEKFQKPAADSPLPEPEDIRALPRPIIGYTGTLSERIDAGILSGLAKRFPKASIVLIGPVHRHLDDLPALPNIHYLGLKKHSQLPAYLHHCKIALLPFKLTKAVLAINPVKTLEYLAAGCVVVSTAIPDVIRFFSNEVTIASSPDDFIEKTAQLLESDNEERIRKGVERARNATWKNMVETMERIMGNTIDSNEQPKR